MAKHRKQNYQIGEWVVAETDSYMEGALQDQDEIEAADWHWNAELQEAQERFTEEANRVVTTWVEENPDKAKDLIESDDYESEDDIAWNTWAALVGHGVGFWENMDGADYKSLQKAIKSDGALSEAQWDVETAMSGAVWSGMLEARVERFMEYLNNTLIPDLEESGAEFTAEDFETLVEFLEDDELEETSDWNIQEFVNYLEGTLIPDLKESGAEYTAEDFEKGIELLRDQSRVEDPRYGNPSRLTVAAAPTTTAPTASTPTRKLKAKLLR